MLRVFGQLSGKSTSSILVNIKNISLNIYQNIAIFLCIVGLLNFSVAWKPFLAISGSSCGRAESVMDLHTTGPGYKTRCIWFTFYWASDWLPPYQHYKVEHSLVCVEGQGRISWSSLTEDIIMCSCVIQCDVPHQWIAQWQVGPVSVYCDRTEWGVVSCVCGMAFLCGSISVKVPLLQEGTIAIWPHILKNDAKAKKNLSLVFQANFFKN